MEKTCKKCNQSKLLIEFRKGKNCCKLCIAKQNKEYRFKNSERIKEQNILYKINNKFKIQQCGKQYRVNNVDRLKEYSKQYSKQYKVRNIDKLREYQKEYTKIYGKKYRELNKEKIKNRSKKYRIENKEKEKIRHQIYGKTETGKLSRRVACSKHRQLLSTLNLDTVQLVYEENTIKYGTLTCELCFKPVKFGEDSLEHFHPVSRKDTYDGDINERKNLGVAHTTCNSSKCDKTLEEYFRHDKLLFEKGN